MANRFVKVTVFRKGMFKIEINLLNDIIIKIDPTEICMIDFTDGSGITGCLKYIKESPLIVSRLDARVISHITSQPWHHFVCETKKENVEKNKMIMDEEVKIYEGVANIINDMVMIKLESEFPDIKKQILKKYIYDHSASYKQILFQVGIRFVMTENELKVFKMSFANQIFSEVKFYINSKNR